MIDAKKEEALNKALTETTDKVNVLDIDVEDDFDVDDIWLKIACEQYVKVSSKYYITSQYKRVI